MPTKTDTAAIESKLAQQKYRAAWWKITHSGQTATTWRDLIAQYCKFHGQESATCHRAWCAMKAGLPHDARAAIRWHRAVIHVAARR